MRISEHAELQRLRELVRHIEAENEPTQLEALFDQLRNLVGLSPEDSNLPDPGEQSLDQPAE
jgi:hypothetical protein